MPETDRPTVPNEACEHPVADHYHGTYACYAICGCRCDDCREAVRRYGKMRKTWAGEFPSRERPMVDAAPVVEHVRSLMDRGMGKDRVAELAGVWPSLMGNIIYGRGGNDPRPGNRLRRETAERILAVELDVADGATVDGAEARAIVAELLRRGWWKSAVARRLEASPSNLLRGEHVKAGTLRDLRQMLLEPVPLRKHSPTGKMYDPSTDHEWQTIPETTPGVPSEWRPGAPVWLDEMRRGLRRAVEESIERHGRVA